jgi:hypothetical protein
MHAMHHDNVNTVRSNRQSAPTAEALLRGVWNEALKDFKSVLSQTQYQKLQTIGSFETLSKEISTLDVAYRKRLVPRVLRKLDPLFEQLKVLTQAISIFIQSNPEIAALVWGSLYTIVEV